MRIIGALSATICFALATGCSGADGPQGPRGPAGAAADGGVPGSPSISAIVPTSAFLGGSATVTISGNATSWSNQAKPDFGNGVTVNSVTVASPTALVAEIDVAFDADLGVRNVTVTDGTDSLTYKGVFHVDAPTKLDTQGTVAQGSIVLAKIRNLDVSRPYDTTQSGDGLFTPITYPNITLSTDSSLAAQVNGVQAYAIDALVLIDADVAVGPAKLDVLSGPVGARTSFPNPAALDVQARTPEALSAGQDKTINVAQPYDSALLTFTPSPGLQIVEVAASTTNADASPQVSMLGTSGHFGDSQGFGPSVAIATDATSQLYVIYWDNTGTSGYAATVVATETSATGGSEGEPNDTSASAQAVSQLPFVVQGASLSSGTDQDWFAVTVPASAAGKKLHVRTFGDDPLTDTVVEVFDTDGTTSLGGPSDDAGYNENWYSDALSGAGTYYVEISASPFFSSSHSQYDAYIKLE
jgi:hypothetical protein